jgi:hypothetical protein
MYLASDLMKNRHGPPCSGVNGPFSSWHDDTMA